MFLLIALTKTGKEVFHLIPHKKTFADRFFVDTSATENLGSKTFSSLGLIKLPYTKPYIEHRFKDAEQTVLDGINGPSLLEALKDLAIKYKEMGSEKLILSDLDFLFESALVRPLEDQNSVIYISIANAYDVLGFHNHAVKVLNDGLEKLEKAENIYSKAALESDSLQAMAEKFQYELFNLRKHISKRDEMLAKINV